MNSAHSGRLFLLAYAMILKPYFFYSYKPFQSLKYLGSFCFLQIQRQQPFQNPFIGQIMRPAIGSSTDPAVERQRVVRLAGFSEILTRI
jgi:hypothetical protein